MRYLFIFSLFAVVSCDQSDYSATEYRGPASTCFDAGGFRYAFNIDLKRFKVITTKGEFVVFYDAPSGRWGSPVSYCIRPKWYDWPVRRTLKIEGIDYFIGQD